MSLKLNKNQFSYILTNVDDFFNTSSSRVASRSTVLELNPWRLRPVRRDGGTPWSCPPPADRTASLRSTASAADANTAELSLYFTCSKRWWNSLILSPSSWQDRFSSLNSFRSWCNTAELTNMLQLTSFLLFISYKSQEKKSVPRDDKVWRGEKAKNFLWLNLLSTETIQGYACGRPRGKQRGYNQELSSALLISVARSGCQAFRPSMAATSCCWQLARLPCTNHSSAFISRTPIMAQLSYPRHQSKLSFHSPAPTAAQLLYSTMARIRFFNKHKQCKN